MGATVLQIVRKADDHSTRHPTRIIDGGPRAALRLLGHYIPVRLPPAVPSPEWTCGTRWVWQVEPTFLVAHGVHPEDAQRAYVCEHQVELD